MKTRRGSGNTKTTIFSIIVLDLILMGLFLFFSDLIVSDFQKSKNISTLIISSFAIVIPGTLLLLIVFQFYKLFKSRFNPGNNFKKNIIVYFIITITIIFIPLSTLTLNFIKASTDNWLNNDVKKAVDAGFSQALEIEGNRKRELKNISKNRFFNSLIIKNFYEKNIEISEINSLNSIISQVDFYSLEGDIVLSIGKYEPTNFTFNADKNNDFYPNNIKNDLDILRYQYKLNIGNKIYIVILSNSRSAKFVKNGYLLTSVNDIFKNSSGDRDINYGLFIYYYLFSIPLILLAILSSFIFSDEIIKPLVDIEEAIRVVARGNYSYRILSKKNNRFNLLINSFNNMIKDIERSRNKLKHTEQISTWQDIATRLAHEIRNPLTPIKLSAQRVLLKEGTSKTQNKIISSHMETIIKEVTRMEKLLNEFRDFARFPNLNLSLHSIKSTIIEAIDIYIPNYPNIEFNLDGLEDIEVNIDKSQIIQVLSNLTINGIHAMNNQGIIDITCEKVQKKGTDHCKISLKDNGIGIPKDNIPNLFKPYFTTKYNGSGLGLAIVNKIILDHKGKIWIESAEGVGTTFYIEFPIGIKNYE